MRWSRSCSFGILRLQSMKLLKESAYLPTRMCAKTKHSEVQRYIQDAEVRPCERNNQDASVGACSNYQLTTVMIETRPM
eukprot:3272101-Amphidinium_carterae.2